MRSDVRVNLGNLFLSLLDAMAPACPDIAQYQQRSAIAEARPYRKGMSKQEIVKIIMQFSERETLAPKFVGLLLDHHDEIDTHVKKAQSAAMDL
jgi:hypothetical protein